MLTESTTQEPGSDPKKETYLLTRWLFMRLLGVIYLTAFVSYALQIIGLNGASGIQPTQELLNQASQQLGIERYWLFPTITWLDCSDAFLQGITIAGTVLSCFVIFGIATGPVLLILSILWLSLVVGGGEFTAFQSDGMLVEATFLSLFFVPWQPFEPPWPVAKRLRLQQPPAPASIWLLRVMLFRIMFASGLVKILSGDPTWLNLTALEYHYETQPIPTPLAWYVHHLPPWFHKVSVLGTFFTELVAPILIFAPRSFRMIGGLSMVTLHLLIALTGNYTYLSFLMILLCIPLFDDRFYERIVPKSLVNAVADSEDTSPPGHVPRILLNTAAAILFLIAGCVFDMTIFGSAAVPLPVRKLIACIAPLRIADRYGLFAVMTTTRPEIVFAGSNDGRSWQSYEFKYKPGDDLGRSPPWVAPHMPRLDWRLWFAAMEPVEASPWVLAFAQRLLEGSREVKIFFEKDPFPNAPPKYIRAFVFDYHFTDAKTKRATGNWWRRDNQKVYLSPLSLRKRG